MYNDAWVYTRDEHVTSVLKITVYRIVLFAIKIF